MIRYEPLHLNHDNNRFRATSTDQTVSICSIESSEGVGLVSKSVRNVWYIRLHQATMVGLEILCTVSQTHIEPKCCTGMDSSCNFSLDKVLITLLLVLLQHLCRVSCFFIIDTFAPFCSQFCRTMNCRYYYDGGPHGPIYQTKRFCRRYTRRL